MASVEFRGVSLRKGDRLLLDGIDLRISPGELFAVIGPSGSGKTSLVRLIAGLERPTTGTVSVGGRRVDSRVPARNRVGMVFESDALYEHLDVAHNLMFPSEMQGAMAATARDRAASEARRVGLRRLWRRRPDTLSAGERGLVATGRALAREPLSVLLLDEPLATADTRLRNRFRAELRRLHDDTDLTTVLATNDQAEALALADRVAVLDAGRIHQIADPSTLVDRPVDIMVAGFVGSPGMNLVPVTVEGGGGEAWLAIGADRWRVPAPLDPGLVGRRLLWGVRAHEWRIAHGDDPFEACLHVTVALVERLGATSLVHVGLGGAAAPAFVVAVDGDVHRSPGDRLEVAVTPRRIRLFDPASGSAVT